MLEGPRALHHVPPPLAHVARAVRPRLPPHAVAHVAQPLAVVHGARLEDVALPRPHQGAAPEVRDRGELRGLEIEERSEERGDSGGYGRETRGKRMGKSRSSDGKGVVSRTEIADSASRRK